MASGVDGMNTSQIRASPCHLGGQVVGTQAAIELIECINGNESVSSRIRTGRDWIGSTEHFAKGVLICLMKAISHYDEFK